VPRYITVSSNLEAIKGREFTLRAQRNCQDSVRITDEAALPKCYCNIEARIPGVIWETVLSLLPYELAKALESSIQETRAQIVATARQRSVRKKGVGRSACAIPTVHMVEHIHHRLDLPVKITLGEERVHLSVAGCPLGCSGKLDLFRNFLVRRVVPLYLPSWGPKWDRYRPSDGSSSRFGREGSVSA